MLLRFGHDPYWEPIREGLEKYLAALQDWLEVSVPSVAPVWERERPIGLRLDRCPPSGQEGWGTWVAHFTLPPSPEVYVSFLVSSRSEPQSKPQDASETQSNTSKKMSITRITAHAAPEAQPTRHRLRSSANPGSLGPDAGVEPGYPPEASEPAVVDRAPLLPGSTQKLRKLEHHLLRVAAAVLPDKERPCLAPQEPHVARKEKDPTWTSALRARHSLARQVQQHLGTAQSTPAGAPFAGVMPQDPALVSVAEQLDTAPWKQLGRIVLELLATGAV